MITFSEFLTEAKEMLDISILSADKFLTSAKRIHDFLFTPCEIEAKTDGVKLTVVKVADDGKLSDYIFAYKGNVLYSSEFNYQPTTKIKSEAIGASQFKLVFDHFGKLGKTNIPVGTELQIEYLMSKPTLSAKYTKKHGMVLVGYSTSTWDVQFGKLRTKNAGFRTAKRDKYALELKLNTPLKIFNGILGTEQTFKRGIISPELKSIFDQQKNSVDWNNENNVYNNIKSMFLEVPSVFGGSEEGVIIKQGDIVLKWQQDYQLDQTLRLKNKQMFRADDAEDENAYWDHVKLAAFDLVKNIKPKTEEAALAELSDALKKYQLGFSHPKKSTAIIKDDIQLSAKTLLLKSMKGNNGCLVVGKFRILTSGHYKLISEALKDYDRVAVCVVTGRDTENSRLLRLKQIKQCFGDKCTIVENSTGNLTTILSKVPFNVNVVFAGSDRVADYSRQLKKHLGISVREMPRTASDISATKVIENLSDETFFKKNTPKQIHDLYPRIVKQYQV